ncbi:MAG TPA: nucleoside deaminase [Bryobacteraceae bacterium]|nr:nucleoside deaminase [Bryobacteraceae bacterium]
MTASADVPFMRMAIEKAREGVLRGQTPFGACIVRDGQVLSCAHNVVWETNDVTAHAEIHAIREACRRLSTIDLSGSVIYSTCEPCPMCFAACHWARIAKIVYGASIQDAWASGFHELQIANVQMRELGGSPIEIVGDFLRDEAVALFHCFDQQPNKRTY